MPFPWIAAATLAGSAISALSQRKANKDNEATQREFAQQGIRWRVEDAKAAGLHPLFALGGNVPSYTPSAQPLFTESMGQNVARAATQFTTEEREARALALEAARAGVRKDNAIAMAYESEAARAQQDQFSSRPVAHSFAMDNPHDRPGADVFVDGQQVVSRNAPITHELPEIAAAHPYLTNSTGPATPSLKRWGFPGIGELITPDAQNFSESLEGLENYATTALIVYANTVHYAGQEARLRKVLSFLKDQAENVSAKAASNVARAIREQILSSRK